MDKSIETWGEANKIKGILLVVVMMHGKLVSSCFVFLDDFKWSDQIKLALGFVRFLNFLHDKGLWAHNISPDHSLVDKVSRITLALSTTVFLLQLLGMIIQC